MKQEKLWLCSSTDRWPLSSLLNLEGTRYLFKRERKKIRVIFVTNSFNNCTRELTKNEKNKSRTTRSHLPKYVDNSTDTRKPWTNCFTILTLSHQILVSPDPLKFQGLCVRFWRCKHTQTRGIWESFLATFSKGHFPKDISKKEKMQNTRSSYDTTNAF